MFCVCFGISHAITKACVNKCLHNIDVCIVDKCADVMTFFICYFLVPVAPSAIVAALKFPSQPQKQ